jgi:hypothetical protein
MSTMTYFLASQLNARGGRLGLTEAYRELKTQVANYVESNFPGATQTPQLVSNFGEEFLLRP